MSEADAAALVDKARAGDVDAWAQLYEHGRSRVARYLARRMPEPADVEDVVQETFLRVPEMAEDYNPETAEVGAWLCSWVARWALIDYGRKDRFRRLSAVEAAQAAAAQETRNGAVEPAYERESRPLSPRMVHALAQLPSGQRKAMQLRYLDELTTEQAAQEVGSTDRGIVAQCRAARKKLRAALADLAPEPDSPLGGMNKKDAATMALARCGGDVPAALTWLREQGVTVDHTYAYRIRNGTRRATPTTDTAKTTGVDADKAIDLDADLSGRCIVDYATQRLTLDREGDQLQGRARMAACRHAVEHGQWPTFSQLAALADVSRSTAGYALKELREDAARHNAPAAAPSPAQSASREPAQAEPAAEQPAAQHSPDTADTALATSLRRTDDALREAQAAVRRLNTGQHAEMDQVAAERERTAQVARWQADERAAQAARDSDRHLGIAS